MPPTPIASMLARGLVRRGAALPLAAAAAAATAATALYVQVRARRAERDHPPAGRLVDVDGLRLHVVELGDPAGAPLVLLHGNVSMAEDFLLGGFAGRAAEGRRVLVFDRPGFGWSGRPRGELAWGPANQARAIRDALRALGAQRPIVLGHSWGALVALALALDFPEDVRGLVLESPYLYPTPRVDSATAAPLELPVIGDLARGTVLPVQFRLGWNAMLERMFAPDGVPPHYRDFPVWMAARPSQLRASAEEMAQAAASAASIAARYAELDVPTVLVAGRGDRVVDPEVHAARLHVERPDTDYRVVEGHGHMLHHTAPEQVLAAIDAVERRAAARGEPGIGRPDGPRIGDEGGTDPAALH